MSATPGSDEGGLARSIGPGLLATMVVGNVLGAGIYVVTGEVAAEVGAQVWLAFGVALGVAAISALSLCELVTKYPGAAGVAAYVDRAFGRPTLTFVTGVAILASGVTSAATAARAFGGDHLQELVGVSAAAAAIAFVVALSAINYWGVVASLRANLAMTAIEVAGLLIVIAAALAILTQGGGDPGRPVTGGHDGPLPLVLLSGAAIAFFAFLGFEDVANLSEEVRRPRRAYPLALFGGLAVTATLYLLVTYLAVAALEPARIAESSAPLLSVVDESPIAVPQEAFALIALIAVANTALANLIMGSRLLYGMSVRGVMPGALRRVDPRRSTPWVAVIATGAAALLLSASGDLGALARTTVLLLLAVLVAMNASAIRLRADAVSHEHFHAPGWAPWAGAITCLVLIANQVLREDPSDALRAGAIVAAGVLLYRIGRRARGTAASFP